MPKKIVNQYERAYRAWPVLTEAAGRREPVTYGQLATAIGMHHRPVRFVLAKIQAYCQEENLPPLTIFVEDEQSNVGAGFIAWAHDNIQEGRKLVYDFPWQKFPNPFAFAADGTAPDEIARGVADNNKNADEKFARVKVRGVAQSIFRSALLRLYGSRCAISGDGGEPLLQAAHIIPWGIATPTQKRCPANGILLSLTYHRMFDLDWLRITQSYHVHVNHNALRGHGLTSTQRDALQVIDGQPIRLPAAQPNWPDKILLAQRYASESIRREAKKELESPIPIAGS